MSFGFGKEFRVTVFGESHGPCVGAVVEGCPPGLEISVEDIQKELDRRKPSGRLATPRREEDRVRILSGIFNGHTNGGPLCMVVDNEDTDSSWYVENRQLPRPGHSDYPAYVKYGGMNDYRGGGFFSGRMTAALVMGGAVAKKLLAGTGIEVTARLIQVGKIRLGGGDVDPFAPAGGGGSDLIEREILEAAREGDSVGGTVECVVLNLPVGVGEPYFDSIESTIAHAVFSIPGVKAIEFGAGFRLAEMRGSEANDEFITSGGAVRTRTNNSGGVLGGLSTGMPLVFRAGIKPTPSIRKPQKTVDLGTMEERIISIEGRHDPCIALRAVPVVEAAAAICIADLMLRCGKNSRRVGGWNGD